MAEDDSFYARAERRIEYLTIGIGASGALCAAIFWNLRSAAGVAVGALLSWLNFRWLKQGIGVLAKLSTAREGAENIRVPRAAYAKFLGRYALLIVVAYVNLRGFRLMAPSLLAGLFAGVAAVLAEMVGQIFRAGRVPRAGS